MSRTKNDRKLQSNSGKNFSVRWQKCPIGAAQFASSIAAARRKEYGGTQGAIKTIVGLTAANERAVENWYDGRNGPSGEFLILLCRHSDQVLETILMLASRTELVKAKKLTDAKGKFLEMLRLIDEIEELAT